MGAVIVKFGDRYCEWSTVSDSPITSLDDREGFIEYYKIQYGLQSLPELMQRLERTDEVGTSHYIQDRQSLIRSNRAGPNETALTKQQLMELFEKWDKEN